MQAIISNTFDGELNLRGRGPGDLKPTADVKTQVIHPSDMGDSSSGMGTATPSGSEANSNVHEPVAICGIGMRLPGNIRTGEQLWELLVNKGDARDTIPFERYNAEAFHAKDRKYGYFLKDVELDRLDASLFKMSRSEIERLDPQHRIMLEITRYVAESK